LDDIRALHAACTIRSGGVDQGSPAQRGAAKQHSELHCVPIGQRHFYWPRNAGHRNFDLDGEAHFAMAA
jgi:hypothetical protein